MATMAIMERGPLRLSQSPLLLLTPLLMLMPGTAIMVRPLRLRTQIRLLPSIRIRLLWLWKEVRRG